MKTIRTKQNLTLPKGYEVYYCEDRGYDSPSRYYESVYKGWLRSYNTAEEAQAACWGHNDGVESAIKNLRGVLGI